MAMLDKVREALQITTTTFNSELSDMLNAGVIDLNIAGVEGDAVAVATTDAVVQRALITYVAYQFERLHGGLDRAEALKTSYDEQKAQLSMHSGYTNWGGVASE